MPPRPRRAMMRYRPPSSVPGTNRPSSSTDEMARAASDSVPAARLLDDTVSARDGKALGSIAFDSNAGLGFGWRPGPQGEKGRDSGMTWQAPDARRWER